MPPFQVKGKGRDGYSNTSDFAHLRFMIAIRCLESYTSCGNLRDSYRMLGPQAEFRDSALGLTRESVENGGEARLNGEIVTSR